jgi:hypothetical protein
MQGRSRGTTIWHRLDSIGTEWKENCGREQSNQGTKQTMRKEDMRNDHDDFFLSNCNKGPSNMSLVQSLSLVEFMTLKKGDMLTVVADGHFVHDDSNTIKWTVSSLGPSRRRSLINVNVDAERKKRTTN